jgi:hypothetical protein
MKEHPSLAIARTVAAYVVLGLVCLLVVTLIFQLQSLGALLMLFSILFLALFLGCLQVILGLRPVSVIEPILTGIARVLLSYRAPDLLLRRSAAASEEILDLTPYLKVETSSPATLKKTDTSV